MGTLDVPARTGGPPHRTGAPRPDASMSLLTDLTDRPLDPSYEAAAHARAVRGEAPRRRPWNTVLTALAALACGLLFATSGLTLARDGLGRQGRAQLVERIAQRQREAEQAAARNADLEAASQARDLAVADPPFASRIERDRVAAGATPVEGPGLRITLDDAPGLEASGGGGPRADPGDDTGRIVYRDLQNVTNELWAAGAEAVAVNGHRLTSTTAIRFAGRAVLVGFRPLARPYVVEAVMGPEARSAFLTGTGGGYLADLRTAYSARAEHRVEPVLRLPPADSTRLEHARVPGDPSSTPAAPSSAAPTTAKENR